MTDDGSGLPDPTITRPARPDGRASSCRVGHGHDRERQRPDAGHRSRPCSMGCSSNCATSTRASARTGRTARSVASPAASSMRRRAARMSGTSCPCAITWQRSRAAPSMLVISCRWCAGSVGLRQGLGDRGGCLAARQRGSPRLLDQRRRRHRRPRPRDGRSAVAGRDPTSRSGRPRRGRAAGLGSSGRHVRRL